MNLTDQPIIRAKLAPPPPTALLDRPRLTALLDAQPAAPLLLLTAPTGFGKTALLSAWLADQPTPSAWLTLDAADNHPARLLRYLAAALQRIDPRLGHRTGAALAGPDATLAPALTHLLNDLADHAPPCTLVLEHYQALTSAAAHELIAQLVAYLPPGVRLAILSRTPPPLPLAALRVQGRLVELRAAHLRFSAAEAHALFGPAAPSPAVTARLHAVVDGWPAALRLLSQPPPDPQEAATLTDEPTAVGWCQRRLQEYLLAHVLQTLPQHIQRFMLETSALDTLSAPLCAAATERQDSADVLLTLLALDLVRALPDAAEPAYAYPALIGAALRHEARHRLSAAQRAAIQQRTSRWHAARGQTVAAVEAAFAGDDLAWAAKLIKRGLTPRVVGHDYQQLRSWIARLPAPLLAEHPQLCVRYALALLFTGDRHAPETYAALVGPLALAEQYWTASGERARLGEVAAVRAIAAWWQGRRAEAFAAAHQALALLPEDAHEARGECLLYLALEQLPHDLTAAYSTALAARTASALAGNPYTVRAATLLLGDLSAQRGALREAAAFYTEIATSSADALTDQHRSRAHALLGLAELAYERDSLTEAAAHLDGSLALLTATTPQRTRAALLQARLNAAHGDLARADAALRACLATAQQPALLAQVEALRLRFALRAGDHASVARWRAARSQRAVADQPQPHADDLLEVRCLLAAHQSEAARALLQRCTPDQRAQSRATLEHAALTALALEQRGEHGAASATLSAALRAAAPEGYRRLFLDEGPALHALLERIGPPAAAPVAVDASPEPLTAQEIRVLHLLASGHTNPQLAAALTVSVNTIKTHLKHIYAKLGVTNRVSACNIARERALLVA